MSMSNFFWVAAIFLLSACNPIKASRNWRDHVQDRLDKQDYVNSSPLIGVLTQPHPLKHHKDSQSISGPLVSWIESAGGRVVPIPYDAQWEEIDKLFQSINGLVLPGGSGELWYGHPFFDTADYLFNLAKHANDHGTIFPVFGICLGFETMHIMIANMTREELLVKSFGQESVANTIEYTDDADTSLFFSYWTNKLMDQATHAEFIPTFNAHEWAVPPSAYDTVKQLDDELIVLSTSTDVRGNEYVSTVEGKHYPFFGTQWHPEKPAYEFADPSIPHSRTAVDAGYATAALIVDVAKLNSHHISYDEQVEMVINKYAPTFLPGKKGGEDPDDPLPDTLWFIPHPKNPRKDPENPRKDPENTSSLLNMLIFGVGDVRGRVEGLLHRKMMN